MSVHVLSFFFLICSLDRQTIVCLPCCLYCSHAVCTQIDISNFCADIPTFCSAIRREREALLRQHNLGNVRVAEAEDACTGRCCLRPGSLGFGDKWCCEKQGFAVRGELQGGCLRAFEQAARLINV